jgi:hypothetical protein
VNTVTRVNSVNTVTRAVGATVDAATAPCYAVVMGPHLILPVELGVTDDDIFHEVDRSLVPELADVLDLLAERHPMVLAAIKDVDRSLIWSVLENTPFENLESCARMVRDLAELNEHLAAPAARKPAA